MNINSEITKINETDFTFFREKHEINKGAPVYLKIYNVTNFNNFYKFLGLGIFHTSVLVYGIEYAFGSSPEGTSGIIEMTDGSLNLNLKEKIFLGNTVFNFDEINEFVHKITDFWKGSQYDPYLKNCNHFTNWFAKKILLVQEINFPNFVNRFTICELLFGCFFKPLKILFGNVVSMRRRQSVNSYTKEKEVEKEREMLKDKETHIEPTIIKVEKAFPISTTFPKNKQINTLKKLSLNTSNKNELNVMNKKRILFIFEELDNDNEYICERSDFHHRFFEDGQLKFQALIGKPIELLNSEICEIKNCFSSSLKKNFTNAEIFYFDEKNYSKALSCFKVSYELIENLLTTKNRLQKLEINPNQNTSTNYDNSNNNLFIKTDSLEELKQSSFKLSGFSGLNKIKMNSDILHFLSENEEFLQNMKIKALHFVVNCCQKLNLIENSEFYLNKLIEFDNYDWVARSKKALLIFHQGKISEARKEFKIIFAHYDSLTLRKEIEDLF